MTTEFCKACGRLRPYVLLEEGIPICKICEPDIRAEIEKYKDVNIATLVKQYFRDHHNGKDYPLRDIPQDLKLAAQHRALDEGLTLRELIFKALEEYLKI